MTSHSPSSSCQSWLIVYIPCSGQGRLGCCNAGCCCTQLQSIYLPTDFNVHCLVISAYQGTILVVNYNRYVRKILGGNAVDVSISFVGSSLHWWIPRGFLNLSALLFHHLFTRVIFIYLHCLLRSICYSAYQASSLALSSPSCS